MIISFEGIDGSGKSTQIKRLLTRLDLLGKETLYVREPGGTAMSERVRDILLDPSLDIHPFAEMLLFSAARAQLVKEKISPFHARGGIVVCDRFFDSTIAYQGGGRGVAEPSWLESFQLEVTGGVIPDRTYFVDITTETAESRLNIRFGEEKAADRMEQAGGAFFERVRNAYLTLAERHSERVCIIDGSGTENEVENAIWEDLSLYL
ncbi:MAG: dTMP kinase [Bacteroidetes Order II. Incertae sedis bacterium]|jgi:dTMP kinase|nr:dTMP kinase [Bacteroidetes Order II. bacterium]MBT4052781.1 dTMP kinase [Bacteroidetes Order II. bacterium]MBT4601599.1 dTMP kinase [Bacteroidetes Order II. bacterium]MBT5249922.1 dTMP kinase [Bacteroidetes Order II. bacterium]MBT6200664.1 dTMP kinase [Bacteroidetes Order II. bacterium]